MPSCFLEDRGVVATCPTQTGAIERACEGTSAECAACCASRGHLNKLTGSRCGATDLMLPGMNGVQATREIKRISPRTQVVVLTSSAEDEHIFPALRAGALSYLLKDIRPSELAESVRKAARGESVLHSAYHGPHDPGSARGDAEAANHLSQCFKIVRPEKNDSYGSRQASMCQTACPNNRPAPSRNTMANTSKPGASSHAPRARSSPMSTT